MSILIALVLSVLLQFAAAFIAISLIRSTKYNISWVLISAAFLMMAFRRLLEVVEIRQSDVGIPETPLSSWIAVAISVLMLVGVIFIKRIFNLQKRIDDMKQENERRVLSAIIRTEETERQKFAKELHDGLGPLMASIKMGVSALVNDKTEPGHRKILDNTDKIIDESLVTLKEISNKLSPHVLNNFGLLKAVRAFVNRLKLPGTPMVKVNSNMEDARFDRNVEVVLYRVICELVTNTMNHAEASEVNIDLYYDEGKIKLDYFDNGKGFKVGDQSVINSGMGFSNIQSRIRSLNGSIHAISNPGEGVCISIVIITKRNG